VSHSTGTVVNRKLVFTIIRRGIVQIPERGGRRYGATTDIKTRFVATVVGYVDHQGYRRGGLGLREAVRQWNISDDEKYVVATATAGRWLDDAGFRPYVPSIGPAINAANECQRQTFHDQHYRHTQNWWLALVFSDSHTVRYRHAPNPHNERVYARRGEKVPAGQRQRRNRRNLNVYGAMCKWGMVGPFFVEGIITGRIYIRSVLGPMLRAIAKIFADNNDRLRWTFQQDGAGPHIFGPTQDYLERSTHRFWSKSEWPGNSPDLSPIENMWPALQSFCTPPNSDPPSEAKLKSLVRAWFKIDHKMVCRKALRGMPRRMELLREASFKYIGK